MRHIVSKRQVVLVGVLKRPRDLRILLWEHWYRIPVAHLPKRRFQYIALYQPASFGRQGSRIRYYARVLRKDRVKRATLLPHEPRHTRANDLYVRVRVGKIQRLSRPITNTAARRVSFGFTTLDRLLRSKTILELFGVAATEEIIRQLLERAGIAAIPQYSVIAGTRRYRLDFAVLCQRGAIAIECDNTRAHSGVLQQAADKTKDACLRRRGWTVIRLREDDILLDPASCLSLVQRAVKKFGQSR